jgi:hypothetical protein
LCSAVQAGLEALGAPEMPADEIQQAQSSVFLDESIKPILKFAILIQRIAGVRLASTACIVANSPPPRCCRGHSCASGASGAPAPLHHGSITAQAPSVQRRCHGWFSGVGGRGARGRGGEAKGAWPGDRGARWPADNHQPFILRSFFLPFFRSFPQREPRGQPALAPGEPGDGALDHGARSGGVSDRGATCLSPLEG